MKKFLMVALVLGLVFSLAQVTLADDRLKMSGDLRVRAFSESDNDHDGDVEDNARYYDMRFRFGMALTVAEGITANLRMDLQDDVKWGSDTGLFGRPNETVTTTTTTTTDGETLSSTSTSRFASKELSIDRAYLRVERDMFIVQAGQIAQYFGQGGYFTAYGPQEMGLALRLKMPVMVDINYFKLDEGTSVVDDLDVAGDAAKDLDLYAVQAQYNAGAFQIGGYYGMIADGTEDNYDPTLIGIWGNTKVGPATLRGAIDMFGGSVSDDVDAMGTQAWLNGEMKVAAAATVGLNLYYALARDPEKDEVQLNTLWSRFGGFEPMEKGIQTLADGLNPAGANQPFDISGDGAGSVGFDVYAIFVPMEKVTLAAQVGYYMPQDDDEDITDWKSATVIEASAKYMFAPKCQLLGVAFYRTVDVRDVDTDAAMSLAALVQVDW